MNENELNEKSIALPSEVLLICYNGILPTPTYICYSVVLLLTTQDIDVALF